MQIRKITSSSYEGLLAQLPDGWIMSVWARIFGRWYGIISSSKS